MQIQVVAEGVENEKQYQFLKKHHCDMVQGYWTDRPMSIEAFKRKYESQQAGK